jgi:hypothetical protein
LGPRDDERHKVGEQKLVASHTGGPSPEAECEEDARDEGEAAPGRSARQRQANIGKGTMWGHISEAHVCQAENELLLEDEIMEAMVKGRVKEGSKKADGFFNIVTGHETDKGGSILKHYLIVTDRRVIFWARGVFKSSTDAFEFEDIKSVEQQKGMIYGGIVLNIHGKKENFTEMHKDEAEYIAGLIRHKVYLAKERPRSAPTLTGTDPAAQIEKLAGLLEKGLISRREFEEKKQKLLDLI